MTSIRCNNISKKHKVIIAGNSLMWFIDARNKNHANTLQNIGVMRAIFFQSLAILNILYLNFRNDNIT